MKQAVVTIKYDEEKLNAVEKCMRNMCRRQSVSTLKAEGMCRLQSKRQTASRAKTVWHPAVPRRMNRERGKHGQDKDSESRAGETSLCEGDCE